MRKFIWLIRRIISQMVRGFTEDRLFQNASSLSFYTLLSIVPIFAILFGIAQGFGLDLLLEREILAGFANNQEIAEKLIVFSRTLLEQSHRGLIAGIGVITLLWTFIGMMGNFERALNDIWHVAESRSFFRRISDFISIAFLCPFYFILSSSLMLYLNTELNQITTSYPFLSEIGPYIKFLIRLLPIGFSFLVFSFLYYYIPNTKVPLKASLTAGFVAGAVFYLVQWIYIKFQIGLATYSTIYGSFAALPLFLIWLQTSWLILLSGAELSYRITYHPHLEAHLPSGLIPINTREMGIWIMSHAVKGFKEGNHLTFHEATNRLKFNHPTLKSVWNTLIEQNYLAEVKGDLNPGVVPAKSPDSITIQEIIDAVNNSSAQSLSVPETDSLNQIKSVLKDYDSAVSSLSQNVLISKI